MEINLSSKVANKFKCIGCHYICSKKSDYNKHLSTKKHIKGIIGNEETNKLSVDYKCKKCNKLYKTNSGLWKHLKNCMQNTDINVSTNVIQQLINENKDFKNIIVELVKSNTEIQKQMVDVCQKITPNNTTIINTNSNNHNKTFNLQFFLNEECKDALNMSDFINSIELKLSDLENMGKLGYVEGMSNIIIKQLNNTELNKRPVHCSDAKRETLYVKDEDKWEKEGPENKKMIKAVRGVDKKNYQMLNAWKTTYPKCLDSKSKQNDEYMILMSKVMDGDAENVNKVIKKVAKEVIIDK